MGLRDIVDKRRAENSKPRTLRELRERKQAEKQEAAVVADPRANGLAALRKSKMQAKSSKHDFTQDGIRYHNVQQVNGYWTIDVSNGDMTYTLHNRYGSWMHDVNGREGVMKEPVVVARMLGTNASQLEVSQALMARLDVEFRMRGIPTREQRIRQREQEDIAARRKQRGKKDDDGA